MEDEYPQYEDYPDTKSYDYAVKEWRKRHPSSNDWDEDNYSNWDDSNERL